VVGLLWVMLGDVIVISKQWMIHGFLALGRNIGSRERECLRFKQQLRHSSSH